jgi:hypothetical protein
MSKSTSETGHVINIENFSGLINFCAGYGAVYNPTKNAIKLSSLETKLNETRNSLSALNSAKANFINAVNARQEAFSGLKFIATRVLNALDASDVRDNIVYDVRTYVRKLRGNSSSKLKSISENGSEKKISNFQLSFDQRIENFDKIISLLLTVPQYNPNEADLTIPSLQNRLLQMRNTNRAHSEALVILSNSRNLRNVNLYHPENGIVKIASEVKKYIKSVYGFKAEEFRQIRSIKFKTLKF